MISTESRAKDVDTFVGVVERTIQTAGAIDGDGRRAVYDRSLAVIESEDVNVAPERLRALREAMSTAIGIVEARYDPPVDAEVQIVVAHALAHDDAPDAPETSEVPEAVVVPTERPGSAEEHLDAVDGTLTSLVAEDRRFQSHRPSRVVAILVAGVLGIGLVVYAAWSPADTQADVEASSISNPQNDG